MKDNHGVILYTQIFEMSDEINLFKLILVYEKIEDIIKNLHALHAYITKGLKAIYKWSYIERRTRSTL